MTRVLAMVLAGGEGKRLLPLTTHHSKPMIPFGGIYRLVDITLSNCVNSGLRRIFILTQHKPLTLHRHVRYTWNILSPALGEFIEILPPMRRVSENWYLGTADAIYQNIQSIQDIAPHYVLILSADHVYKMNYRRLIEWHCKQHADVTIATTQVRPDEAHHYGIVRLDRSCRILGFEEKPSHHNVSRSCFNPEACSASMGVYVFSTPVLLEALQRDAAKSGSSHDFGRDVIPELLSTGHRVFAFDFIDENRKEVRYWRDVGTLDAYYQTSMDLVATTPVFNLYDESWPLRAAHISAPPAKFVFADPTRRGIALDSIVSHGCIVSGGTVNRSILSPGVRIDSFSEVDQSILFERSRVGRRARLRRVIVDSGVTIPDGMSIGFDAQADRERGFHVTPDGVTIVANGNPTPIPPPGLDPHSALW
jgi:glucose-1-phosphate adenylyltransferase